MFHSLHYSQESLRNVCLLQFSLISVQPLHFYISLWSLQIALVIDFLRVIIITSVLFGRSKAAYWLCWHKRCHKGLLHLQKIVSQPFLENREHIAIANLNIQKWHVYHHGCEGRKLQQKQLYFHKEKDWLDAVVTAENLTYLFLMQVNQINWFSMVKLREARSEEEIGLFITTRIHQFEEN